MRSLVLMEQGIRLGVEGGEYLVQRERVVIKRVRRADVDRVLVFGNVELTPGALHRLLADGTDTVFLSARGRYRGRLMGAYPKGVELRLAQYRLMQDPAARLEIARRIVQGKIANQRTLLLRIQRERRDADLAATTARLRLHLDDAGSGADLDNLRGVEGAAAALYFPAFGRGLRDPRFRFEKRTRRPPLDPVNALLSFGYTLLGTLAEGFVLRAGLDPMLGALHDPEFGRPSLALDLIEEFRPVLVDSLVLRMINRREVAPEDFEVVRPDRTDEILAGIEDAEEGDGGALPVYLNASGRKILFRAWARKLNEVVLYEPTGQRLGYEQVVEQQVRAMARHLRSGGETDGYRPFRAR